MTALSRDDMLEATRLTREGRLAEAMALLQGRPALDPMARTAGPAPSPRQPSKSGLDGTASPVIEATFERLAATPRQPASRHAQPRPAAAQNGQFDTHSYADANGRRDYKLFAPSGLPSGQVPLVVMLHGCTQSPDDFAAGTRMNELAGQHGFIVAYPAQSRTANASGCWNWFNATDQQRDGGEPALLAGITRQIIAEHPVDPARVYVAGLSAGGAAAAIMGARYRDLYAAIGVHSGLACGAAKDMPSAFAAMQNGGGQTPSAGDGIPAIVFHGTRDTTVHPRNGEQVIAQSKGAASLRATRTEGRSQGGTRYTKTIHADAGGKPVLEHWVLDGVGHAWSGGSAAGTYTYPEGPDASAEMVRFFLERSSQRVSS